MDYPVKNPILRQILRCSCIAPAALSALLSAAYADDQAASARKAMEIQIPSIPERKPTVSVEDDNLPTQLIDAQLGGRTTSPDQPQQPAASSQSFTLDATPQQSTKRKPVNRQAQTEPALPKMRIAKVMPMHQQVLLDDGATSTMATTQPAPSVATPQPQASVASSALPANRRPPAANPNAANYAAKTAPSPSLLETPALSWINRLVGDEPDTTTSVVQPATPLPPHTLPQAVRKTIPQAPTQNVAVQATAAAHTFEALQPAAGHTALEEPASQPHLSVELDIPPAPAQRNMFTQTLQAPKSVAATDMQRVERLKLEQAAQKLSQSLQGIDPFTPVKLHTPKAEEQLALAEQKPTPESLAAMEPAAGKASPASALYVYAKPHASVVIDDGSELVTAPPPVLAAVAEPELSEQSKRMLQKIPSRLDTPKKQQTERIDIERERKIDDIISEDAQTIASLDQMGLKIEVKRPVLDVQVEMQRAYDALLSGQNSVAIEIYQNVLKEQPGNTNALFGIGSAYHRAGMLPEARSYYAKVLKIDRDHRDALNNFLGLIGEEAPGEALIKLQELQQKNPDFSPIPAQIAFIYQKQGDLDNAREYMMKAISLAPENLAYRFNLAILLDKQGAGTEAAVIYQDLLDAHLRGETIPGDARMIQERLTFIRSNRG